MSYKSFKKILVTIPVLLLLGLGAYLNITATPVFGAPTSSSASYRHIYPFTNNTYDLGTTTQKWRSVNATTYYGDGSQLTGVTTDLSGYVPYTGATSDVDLGSYKLKTPAIKNSSSVEVVDIDNQSLNDNTGFPQFTWSSSGVNIPTGIVDDTNVMSLNTNARTGTNSSNYTTIDWQNALYYDAAGASSASLSNRFFTASDGSTQVLNYYNATGVRIAPKLAIGSTISLVPISALHIDNGTGVASDLRFTAGATTGQTTSDGFQIGIDTTGIAQIRQRENTALELYTNNTLRMSISGAGNMSIDGSASLRGAAGTAAAPFYTFAGVSDTGLYRSTGSTLGFATTGTARMFINTSGNIIIGNSTSPSARLHVLSTTEQLRIDNNGTSFTKITQTSGNSLGFVPAVNNASAFVFYQADGATSAVRIDTANIRLGIGVQPTVSLHVLSTGEQFRSAYSSSVYWNAITDSAGLTTFNAVNGAGSPSFAFSDPVAINGSLTLSAQNIITDTTTGMKIGTGTTQKLGFFNATPIVQVPATTEIGTALSDLGLRASGSAYPITTSGLGTLTGGQVRGYVSKSSNYTITSSDYLIHTTAAVTITLPTAVGITGQVFAIKHTSAFPTTVDTTSSQTIDGTTTKTLVQYEGIVVMSNGTNWIIISKI
jgi:hypothetical protein